MIRRLARKSAKYAGVGMGLCGAATLVNMKLNDDMDDLAYMFQRPLYKWSRPSSTLEKKKVVVLGSGWGALSFARKLDREEYDVTMVSPRPFFFYTPLLCGSTTGTVSNRSIIEPVREQVPEGQYVRASCKRVDLEKKTVVCSDADIDTDIEIPYDHLVIAVGAQPNTFGIPGVDKYGMYLKEIEHGVKVRKRLLNMFESANIAAVAGDIDKVKKLLSFVVVGGGPTGVELCGEVSDFVKKDVSKRFPQLVPYFQLTLVEALPRVLTMFHESVATYVQDHLSNQGVDVRTKAMVKQAEEDCVHLKLADQSIEKLDYGCLVWVAGVGTRPFVKELCAQIGEENGQKDRRGLVVDECLRVKGTNRGEVFALGDCAFSGKPPTAQVAAQQGKYMGRMFRLGKQHLISDPEAAPFEYHHQGTMAYIGDNSAATELNPNAMIKLGRSSITDHMWWRSLYGDNQQLRVMGPVGFAIWRSVYFSKIFSARNRFTVSADWLRSMIFGRPVASPVQTT